MNTSDIYASSYPVAQASEADRTTFYQRTYLHLGGAVAAFVILEMLLFSIPNIENIVFSMLARSPFSWLIVLGAFMAASWIAEKWANSSTSKATQYGGLALFIVAEAIIFLPLLLMAARMMGQPELIGQAGIITAGLFAGLTFIAFTTKKDFSFLGGILKIAGFIALGLIAASFFFGGLNLGVWFSAAMVLFAGGSILYQTSNIIHHYNKEQYVAASLGLFASVALLFWYVLRILMAFSGRD